LLDRWLATLVKLEQNHISPFVILTFCSSEFVEFLIGYSPSSSHIRTFQVVSEPWSPFIEGLTTSVHKI
jgi:hypothetical protein